MAVAREQVLVYHAHQRHNATNHSANASKEGDPSLSIAFDNLDMKWAHFVKEKDSRKSFRS